MNMYLLISCSEDGDSYNLFDNLDQAKESFKEAKDSKWNQMVVLCSPKPGDSFGFGSHGFYGCEVIEEWDSWEDE